MSYDFLFYSILALSTAMVAKYFIGPKWWNPRYRIGKIFKSSGLILLGFAALMLWSLKVLEATAPKGTMWHEAARLPKHFYKLAEQKADDLLVERINYGSNKRQYLLFCQSKNTAVSQDKIIFYVHGGGWHVGSPAMHLHLAQTFANAGYAVIMPAYRLGPYHGYQDLTADMHAALQAALQLRSEKGWEEKTFVLGGTSAGGNLAALLLYDREKLEEIQLSQDIFSGLFSLAGALDIESMPHSFVLNNYAGSRKEGQFHQANPLCHLRGDECIPVLCIHGTADGLVNVDAASSFVRQLQEIDPDIVRYHCIPNATHIEIATRWYYNPDADFGQADMLLNWLKDL